MLTIQRDDVSEFVTIRPYSLATTGPGDVLETVKMGHMPITVRDCVSKYVQTTKIPMGTQRQIHALVCVQLVTSLIHSARHACNSVHS